MFEFSCDRSGLFSEKYLSQPIGQILTAASGGRVIAEYKHEPLARNMNGKGRRPEIDFAVCNPYPNVKIAVESKWIGKTKPTVQSIVWDIIRLEMLANEFDAECYFILGGRKSSLDAYLGSKSFTGPENITGKPVLKYDINASYNLDISPQIPHRRPMMKKVFKQFQEVPFPTKIPTSRQTPFPENPKSNQFQIITWKNFFERP